MYTNDKHADSRTYQQVNYTGSGMVATNARGPKRGSCCLFGVAWLMIRALPFILILIVIAIILVNLNTF